MNNVNYFPTGKPLLQLMVFIHMMCIWHLKLKMIENDVFHLENQMKLYQRKYISFYVFMFLSFLNNHKKKIELDFNTIDKNIEAKQMSTKINTIQMEINKLKNNDAGNSRKILLLSNLSELLDDEIEKIEELEEKRRLKEQLDLELKEKLEKTIDFEFFLKEIHSVEDWQKLILLNNLSQIISKEIEIRIEVQDKIKQREELEEELSQPKQLDNVELFNEIGIVSGDLLSITGCYILLLNFINIIIKLFVKIFP